MSVSSQLNLHEMADNEWESEWAREWENELCIFGIDDKSIIWRRMCMWELSVWEEERVAMLQRSKVVVSFVDLQQ